MKIMTVVKGLVPPDRREAFEAAYREVTGPGLPPGLELSFLVRGAGGTGSYMIETIWSSREALEAMRASTKPRAVALFEDVGVTPEVEVHEIAGSVPPGPKSATGTA